MELKEEITVTELRSTIKELGDLAHQHLSANSMKKFKEINGIIHDLRLRIYNRVQYVINYEKNKKNYRDRLF